jgi:hypothetical protein
MGVNVSLLAHWWAATSHGSSKCSLSQLNQIFQKTVSIFTIMKTGFIGDLGTKCSQCGSNIVVFHLGRSDVGGEAVLLVGIDDALSA